MGKPKVLGIGAPRFAKPEFEELQKVAEVHWFKPEVSEQVCSFSTVYVTNSRGLGGEGSGSHLQGAWTIRRRLRPLQHCKMSVLVFLNVKVLLIWI